MNVGTRELKNRLSYYLRRVREGGESLQVTDRGEIIAEVRPAPKARRSSDRKALLALSAKGELSLGTGRFRDFKPVKPKAGTSIARHVIEGRR